MALLDSVLLWWHRAKTRAKMDRVFSRGEDPYGYRSSPYEAARLSAMEEALGGRRYERALEVGCAEGAFTERLARAAAEICALDISPVALERARRRLGASARVSFVEADIRDWTPSAARYDLIVIGDVLYYLDKPMVRRAFAEAFPRVAGWLAAGGRLILAHGFAGEAELAHRRGFRERFERLGLRLSAERIVGGEVSPGGVRCLLSALDRD